MTPSANPFYRHIKPGGHHVGNQRSHREGEGRRASSGEGFNRKIALVIAILALFLSFSETLGKGAQTEATTKNIEASDLWAFFQAKNIRTHRE